MTTTIDTTTRAYHLRKIFIEGAVIEAMRNLKHNDDAYWMTRSHNHGAMIWGAFDDSRRGEWTVTVADAQDAGITVKLLNDNDTIVHREITVKDATRDLLAAVIVAMAASIADIL